VLLPLAWRVLRKDSPIWPLWRQYMLLGLLGIGCYNALLYLALKTSTPLNVTLVSSSMPVWMLAIGRLCWGIRVSRRQMGGALLSVLGVAVVMSRGDWQTLLALRFVPGDLFMVLATIAWAFYTWLLSRSTGPQEVKSHWASFLLAQIVFGLLWSGLFTGGEALLGEFRLVPGWPLLGSLLFIAVGPAILAYRFWGMGVQRAPAIAGFFGNLIPLFTALLSIVLGETPHLYHALAFALIVTGIVVPQINGCPLRKSPALRALSFQHSITDQ
jgi:drug/metabolite transporter (DMT)-like permease